MMTYHVVQAFTRGRKGSISADTPMAVQSAEQALRMAQRLSSTKVGVVAFSRSGDPSLGDYEDPVILAKYGHVPTSEG